MDLDVIITGIIGIITTVIGSWASWFFARKKYNSEVDNNLIENMQKSLEFYKRLSDDNKERLEEVLKRNDRLEEKNDALEKEINELKTQIFSLMSSFCSDIACQVRKKNLTLFKNEVKINKKIQEK